VAESLGAVRAVLDEVGQRLRTAHHLAHWAERRLAEARALLAELDKLHHEPLLPPELARADEELTRGLGLISNGVESVAALDARL
jgi:hypothetical protein